MKYPFTALFVATCVSFYTLADTVKVKNDAPTEYVVKQGDTLWDISNIYLSTPWQWQILWKQNPQLEDPDLIYPGDVLQLKYDAQGNPILAFKKSVKKLSPSARVALQKSNAIPTLPMSVVEPILAYELALDKARTENRPYILGANYNIKLATQGHLLYVKGELQRYTHYGIYRVGEPYLDPESNNVLAYRTTLVGSGRVLDEGNLAQGKPATVKVEMVKKEIKAQDILIPLSEGQSFSAQFGMQRPKQAITGNIIASDNNLREFGSTSVVVLNLGREQQLKEGHVLDISKRSPTVIEGGAGPRYVEDANSFEKFSKNVQELFGADTSEQNVVWTMPQEKVGELMVFKVYDKVSYALVTSATQPIRVGDSVGVN